jgi:hypothetical protein
MLRFPALPFAAAAALCALAAPASAQTFKPVESLVINPSTRPVPVTGTLRLEGGSRSGDRTVTAYDQFLTVDTPNFGNHVTGQIDVADFKEVRVSVARSGCSPCSQVEVSVHGITEGGRFFPIDEFVANQNGNGAFPWASRTYSTPGSRLRVALRAVNGGTTQSVLVTVVGRAN